MSESMTLKVFIGYDPVEKVAWHTLAESILDQSSRPVALIPVNLRNLKNIYTRERDPKQSNEFSFSRFLVPYLCGFQGQAVYFDCDQLIRTDLFELFQIGMNQPDLAVHVVKHDYQPKDTFKYLDTKQYSYPRKNWSSVVLWNCSHPANRIVSPEFVSNSEPKVLHRFGWLEDSMIGSLDIRWNWLVGEYEDPPDDVKLVHWTVGGPYFDEYKNADFADNWFDYRDRMTSCIQRKSFKK